MTSSQSLQANHDSRRTDIHPDASRVNQGELVNLSWLPFLMLMQKVELFTSW